jgi:hypothetical protein
VSQPRATSNRARATVLPGPRSPRNVESSASHSSPRSKIHQAPAHTIAEDVPGSIPRHDSRPWPRPLRRVATDAAIRGQGDRRGTDRGRRRLRPRHRPGTHAFHRCDGAPKARAALLPGLKAARLQPTPSPDRSPDPARQPALAPGLSLVPHGCGDPLIRLVQDPRNNRVLEGWCSGCTRKKPPRAFERPGARAGCRAGPGDRSPKSPPASRAREFPKRGLARL